MIYFIISEQNLNHANSCVAVFRLSAEFAWDFPPFSMHQVIAIFLPPFISCCPSTFSWQPVHTTRHITSPWRHWQTDVERRYWLAIKQSACVCLFFNSLLQYKLHARTRTDIKDHVIWWLMGPCESHSKARGWDQWGGFIPCSKGVRFASTWLRLLPAGRLWPVMGAWVPLQIVLTSGECAAQYEQWDC